MEFYVVFCISLFILTIFTVGESVLKNNNLQNWQIIAFLLLTTIFFYLPNIKLPFFLISINYILYFFVFIISLAKIKSIKNLGKICLVSVISLALSVCYNSLNLLQYEFSYFQPYIILAILFAVIFSFITDNVFNVYLGLFIGISLSELIKKSVSKIYLEQEFCLGDSQFLEVMLISLFAFLMVRQFIYLIKKARLKNFNKNKIDKSKI